MYKLNADEKELTIQLASKFTLIDRVVEDTIAMMVDGESYETTPINQVIRELLLNAVEHGNDNAIEKMITFSIVVLSPGRYRISVLDEGKKLRPKNLIVDLQIAADSPRKKGMIIVNNFCDDISINPETFAIEAIITLPQKMDWGISKESDRYTLLPSRDISATALTPLKRILREWLNSSVPLCELNLARVESIDSITLSLLISFSKEIVPGRSLIITNVNSELMQLFNVTQLKRLFTITGAEDE